MPAAAPTPVTPTPATSSPEASPRRAGIGGTATSAGVNVRTICPPTVMPSPASSGWNTTRYSSPTCCKVQPPDVPPRPTLHSGLRSSKPVSTTSNRPVSNGSSGQMMSSASWPVDSCADGNV